MLYIDCYIFTINNEEIFRDKGFHETYFNMIINFYLYSMLMDKRVWNSDSNVTILCILGYTKETYQLDFSL